MLGTPMGQKDPDKGVTKKGKRKVYYVERKRPIEHGSLRHHLLGGSFAIETQTFLSRERKGTVNKALGKRKIGLGGKSQKPHSQKQVTISRWY